MAVQTAAQKIKALQNELDDANARIEELENYLRDGVTLLDPEDVEDTLDEIEGDDSDE